MRKYLSYYPNDQNEIKKNILFTKRSLFTSSTQIKMNPLKNIYGAAINKHDSNPNLLFNSKSLDKGTT